MWIKFAQYGPKEKKKKKKKKWNVQDGSKEFRNEV